MARRVFYLDGLRGWASVAVVLYHFDDGLRVPFFHPTGSPALGATDFSIAALGAAVLRLAFDGKLAVAIFFILSGIVLSGAVSRAIESEDRPRPTLPGLIAKRYVRLALPITASTLLGFVALHWFTVADFRQLEVYANLAATSWTTRMATCGPCLAPTIAGALREGLWAAFEGYLPSYNHVLWTMVFELIGSILIFVLVLVARTPSLRRIATLLAFLAARGTYFGDFFLGALIYEFAPIVHHKAEVHATGRRALDLLGLGLAALGFAGAAISQIVPQIAQPLHAEADQLAVATGWIGSPAFFRAALVTSGCALSPTLQNMLSGFISRFLGRISFSLYLIHTAVLMLVAFPIYLHFVAAGANASVTALLLMLAMVPLAVGLAAPYYAVVEHPSIVVAGKIGRGFDRVISRGWRTLRKSENSHDND